MLRNRLAAVPSGRATKWITVVMWLLLVAALSPMASKLTDVSKNDAASWLPRGAEATEAMNRAESAFPGSDKLVAVVVYARDGGLDATDNAKVNADRAVFQGLADGGRISPPIPDAQSGTPGAVLVSFPVKGADGKAQQVSIDAIEKQVHADVPGGLRVALTGSAGAVKDITDAFGGLGSTLLYVTVAVVAVLLLITYRSPILWLVPLFSVGFASQLASAVVYLLAKHDIITVNGQSQGILTVLVFGAGTDYALLLIARYREELRRNANRHEAMKIALGASFPAILASGATVAIGLLCLLAAQLNNIRGLGPVGAIGIISALIAMTTLLPALLVVCGRWLFWPIIPRYDPEAAAHDIAEEHGIWSRIAAFVGRRPRAVWLVTVLILGGLAVGMTTLRVGQNGTDQYTKEVGSVTGQKILAEHFPAGSSAPTDIYAKADRADAVIAAAKQVPGVTSVGVLATGGGQGGGPAAQISADGQWVHVPVVLDADPQTKAAENTVVALRTAVHAVPEADALVGGQTAIKLDTQNAANHDNRLVIPLILVVVFLVLVLLLRALVAPVLLLASVVLSFATAMGTASLIFHAIGHPRIDNGMPLLGFLFLVALGVDYTIFLMTRAREETAKLGHTEGVKHSLAVTGGVITSAGLVLAATFGVLAVLPLTTMLQLGIIVAVGVLMDTLIIRTLLVPALSLDVGPMMWWPSRLAATGRAPVLPGAAADGPAGAPEPEKVTADR
jgi:putative drug exporter of the RND superfamily